VNCEAAMRHSAPNNELEPTAVHNDVVGYIQQQLQQLHDDKLVIIYYHQTYGQVNAWPTQ